MSDHVDRFLFDIEGYYGQYPPKMKNAIAQFLVSRGLKPTTLDKLYALVLLKKEKSFGYQPTVKTFDDLLSEIFSTVPEYKRQTGPDFRGTDCPERKEFLEVMDKMKLELKRRRLGL